MYSSLLEDSACRPREEQVLCLQCKRVHAVHKNDALHGKFVTEDKELYNAFVPHNEKDGNHVFRDKLIAAGVKLNNICPL